MRAVIPLVLALSTLAGCVWEDRAPDGSLSVIGEASLDYARPGDTVAEWVEYGDALAVVRVTAQTPPVGWPAYKDSGGLVGRELTVRVESTTWRRPGSPAAPGRFSFGAWGWMYDDDQDPDSPRYRLVAEGSKRMEVGRRYLAVLTRDRGEWSPLRDTAVMTLGKDGRVTSEVDAGEPSPGAAAMRGLTPREAGAALAGAERD